MKTLPRAKVKFTSDKQRGPSATRARRCGRNLYEIVDQGPNLYQGTKRLPNIMVPEKTKGAAGTLYEIKDNPRGMLDRRTSPAYQRALAKRNKTKDPPAPGSADKRKDRALPRPGGRAAQASRRVLSGTQKLLMRSRTRSSEVGKAKSRRRRR